MRICIACKKRVTISEDGVCDVCRGHAGLDLDGYLSQLSAQEAALEIERENSKKEDNFCWANLKE